ncbi:glycosyltransferase family 1 protein [Salinicola sp. DM10]|uniref:glycosyltransferase family 4 protein n=1 Tax=Salinicola sp. DM10 TaxID=2815721 RepID=UPI001A8F6C7D|nr:glycosyltransferase family 1 protein [Salinicola sp. DM10]MCE3027172.1 glycosyltransferase family 4 protein [Salinicola sp. DM10]
MEVIVNIQSLSGPLTGIGHYTRELLRQLVAHQPGQVPAMTLLGLRGPRLETLDAGHPLLQEATPAPAASGRARWLRRYLRNPMTRFAYHQLFAQRLRWHALGPRGASTALYWEPGFIRLPWPGRSVVTVHDLSHCRYPEYHPAERVAYFRRHLAPGLSRATRINVVSRFTAAELSDLFDIDPARIDIVSPGVSERFFTASPADRERVRQRYALPECYWLSVGTLEPRKNLRTLLAAFLSLSPARQHACPLVMVGGDGWGDQALPDGLRDALDEGRVRRLGYVEDAALPALYANASGFAYVSLYEGFGMPIIEAMAAGAPVLTADRSATCEVAGDAALCVDPASLDAVRDGLVRLQDDNELRQRLRQAGQQRARGYTWQRSAEALTASFIHATTR